MHQLNIDASRLQTTDDVYGALFQAWGAPDWHGCNFNALRDSLLTGHVNRVEPPFRITITGAGAAGPVARATLSQFRDLINELAPELKAAGRTIELTLSDDRAS